MLIFPRRMIGALLLAVLVCGSILLPHAPAAAQSERTERAQPARHIIICVDGVGFSLIERMRAEGRFRMFRAPARMISPFPTLTNLAMTEILEPVGVRESPGYEDNYFDTEANRMRGGLMDRFRGDRFISGTFRELFDYHPSAIKSGLGYAAPPLSTYLEAIADLVTLRRRARSSREPVFFAYTGATDTLAHLGGERLLRSFLAQLDDSIAEIQRDSGGRTEVTIFSDHGNHFRGYRRAPLKDALRRAGFSLDGRLRHERSVVLPQFGLVGCALLFTRAENEARVAQATATARGVDFAAYESGGLVHIVSRSGNATIEQRGGRYRYTTQSGDPLALAAITRALREQGRADADGFIADADWFAATREGARPDAVRRVYEGLTNHVRHRANVVVNFEDGYYTGSAALDIFAFLQATHGNLGAEQSFGFVMNTERELPAHMRAESVWQAIGSPALNRAALAGRHHRHSPEN